MATTPPQRPRQLRIEMPANLGSTYANAAMVSQTHSEIIMSFVQIMPNDPRAVMQSRIVMTPANAKMFMKALQTQITRFEEQHGEISTPPQPPSLADHLFGSVKPEDFDLSGEGGGQPHNG